MDQKDHQSMEQFTEVIEKERRLIAARRSKGVGEEAEKPEQLELSALAFSGGGIRSAVFNLGFIQGLAGRRSLQVFDYLSTVSGGGYIGAWYSALIRRQGGAQAGEDEVQSLQGRLASPPVQDGRPDPESLGLPESLPVRFVRRYANYLTPQVGLSGDTLAMVAIMVRNIAVMQMLLVSLMLAVFSSLLLLAGSDLLAGWGMGRVNGAKQTFWLLLPAFGALILALLVAQRSQTTDQRMFSARYPNLAITVVLLAAMAAGGLLALEIQGAGEDGRDIRLGGWEWGLPLLYGLAWFASIRRDSSCFKHRALLAILGGGLTLVLLVKWALERLPMLLAHAPFGHVIAFSPLATLLALSLVITVHLALAGPLLLEQTREWWARLGGQGVALALAWAVAFCFLLYAPPLLQFGAEWSVAGSGVWTVLTWLGARLSHSDRTGDGTSQSLELAARLAPWLFVMGLLGLTAWGFAWMALGHAPGAGGGDLAGMQEAYLKDLQHVHIPSVLGLLALAAALFFLFVKSVDLNLFSLHSFYTNRLARTFLGASHDKRQPNRYTGFDPNDDLPLTALAEQRPVHLINTNLNLDGGQELAWQTRRGASFQLSALYCGYATRSSMGRDLGGFRPTKRYSGGTLTLATAVAVSGAAASPNMGFHTSTPVAALLTAFNLRLARWCPNPERRHWQREAPVMSVGPLFAELTGNADSRSKWINLSDGGHFENLGLYELVRRRAGLIVVTDVSADGEYRFDDLAMAVRKTWVDLGVRIDIPASELDRIRPRPGEPGKPSLSARSWALGRIHYPDRAPGYMVYVKSSLGEDAPVDLRQYQDARPAFPHESTADQWFDEDQFEAYRHLGQRIAEEVYDSVLISEGVAARRILDVQRRIATLLADA